MVSSALSRGLIPIRHGIPVGATTLFASLSLPRRRGEGRGEGLRASAWVAAPLVRPAATFSPRCATGRRHSVTRAGGVFFFLAGGALAGAGAAGLLVFVAVLAVFHPPGGQHRVAQRVEVILGGLQRVEQPVERREGGVIDGQLARLRRAMAAMADVDGLLALPTENRGESCLRPQLSLCQPVMRIGNAFRQTREGLAQTGEAVGKTRESVMQTGELVRQTGEAVGQSGELVEQSREVLCQTGQSVAQTGQVVRLCGEAVGQTRAWLGRTGASPGNWREPVRQTAFPAAHSPWCGWRAGEQPPPPAFRLGRSGRALGVAAGVAGPGDYSTSASSTSRLRSFRDLAAAAMMAVTSRISCCGTCSTPVSTIFRNTWLMRKIW